MIPSEAVAQQILQEALSQARRAAPGAEVLCSLRSGRRAHARFAENELTSAGDVDEVVLTVTLQQGRRRAAATTNQTDAPSLARVATTAAQAALLAPEDPEAMAVLGAQRYGQAPLSFDEALRRLSPRDRAAAAEAVIAAAEAAGLVAAGFFEHSATAHALKSSAGLWAYHRGTQQHFSTTARSPDGTGSGFAGAFGQRRGELDPLALARVAIDKAQGSRQPRRLEPGRYTVVLEPEAVADLLSFLVGSLSARQADEGRSFFAKAGGGNRIGERLFPPFITLFSDPLSEETAARPFDGEGMPLGRRTFLDQGALSALHYSRFWAQKQGAQASGDPGVYCLRGGDQTTAQLIAGTKRGVLVTRLWYTRLVDPQSLLVTGLTRDGVFLIEDGKLAGPVNNFRFNESPVTMLKNAEALGQATVRTWGSGGRLRVPAMRTGQFNLASISEAV